ncbi:MAG TPA: hypothetical protein VEZ12_19905 [Herpetosiphonaceae bacterium]|nr:hypothetical protein [Herpetosiphonaceae bacterium]
MQRLDRRWFHALVVLLLVVAVGAGGMWPASYVAAAPPSNLPAD